MKQQGKNRVLIIEDNDTMIDFLTLFFNDCDVEYDITKCPQVALELIDKKQYKIAFLDVTLGAQDGSKYASIIQKKNTKVVMLTAKDKKWLDENITVPTEYLRKPFSLDEMLNILKKNGIV